MGLSKSQIRSYDWEDDSQAETAIAIDKVSLLSETRVNLNPFWKD